MENRWKMVEVCGILVAGAFLERVRVMPFVSISIAGERSTDVEICNAESGAQTGFRQSAGPSELQQSRVLGLERAEKSRLNHLTMLDIV